MPWLLRFSCAFLPRESWLPGWSSQASAKDVRQESGTQVAAKINGGKIQNLNILKRKDYLYIDYLICRVSAELLVSELVDTLSTLSFLLWHCGCAQAHASAIFVSAMVLTLVAVEALRKLQRNSLPWGPTWDLYGTYMGAGNDMGRRNRWSNVAGA